MDGIEQWFSRVETWDIVLFLKAILLASIWWMIKLRDDDDEK